MASHYIYYERTWIRLFCKCGRSKQQNATIAVTFAALLDLSFLPPYYWIASFTALLLKSFLYIFIIDEPLLPPYYWRASFTLLLFESFFYRLIIEELLLPPCYWRASFTALLLKSFLYTFIIREFFYRLVIEEHL